MRDIKQLYTIENHDVNDFSRDVLQISNDLQSDGLDVEVQYQTFAIGELPYYTAMIIGRGK